MARPRHEDDSPIHFTFSGGRFRLECAVDVNASIDDVFEFFSNAANLDDLTPPYLKFEILTPRPIQMRVGTLIDYQLRLRGLPVRWQSEITAWEPPHRFIDEQRRGPYRHWIHEHKFESAGPNATRVIDVVNYGVIGGRLVNALFVQPDLRRIFDYRREQLTERFDKTR